MTILGIPEAAYYCGRYSGTGGSARGSFRSLSDSYPKGRTLTEGTLAFDEFRDCSLREVERLLFLSVSHYRRSFDLMIPSASSWAQVTMYYGSFFAASSLLGMFGLWKLRNDKIIDVARGNPGSQQFLVGSFRSLHKGSHKAFWDLFYSSTAPLTTWVDPLLRFAISPVLGQVTWLIDTRNNTNYDSHSACDLVGSFSSAAHECGGTKTLPGDLSTHFRVMEGLLSIAAGFARQFKIRTDALSHIPPTSRQRRVRELIFDATARDPGRALRRKAVSF